MAYTRKVIVCPECGGTEDDSGEPVQYCHCGCRIEVLVDVESRVDDLLREQDGRGGNRYSQFRRSKAFMRNEPAVRWRKRPKEGQSKICPLCGRTDAKCFGSRRECACGNVWSTAKYWKESQRAQCEEQIKERSDYAKKALRELGADEHGNPLAKVDAAREKALASAVPPGSSPLAEEVKAHVAGTSGTGYRKTFLKPTEGYGMRFKRWRLGKMKVTLLDMARHDATRSQLLKLHKHELQRQQLTRRELMPFMHLIWTIAREHEIARRSNGPRVESANPGCVEVWEGCEQTA